MTLFKTDTNQIKTWQRIGAEYTKGNPYDPAGREKARSYFFKYATDLDRSLKILEVGCNNGTNLGVLKNMGFKNLSGVDVLSDAIESAKKNVPDATFQVGSILELPFEDNSFDLVFTCGVLIHVHPNEVTQAINEIHRCSKKYIWGFEYYNEVCEEAAFRARDACWSADFASLYAQNHDDLNLLHDDVIAMNHRTYDIGVFFLEKNK